MFADEQTVTRYGEAAEFLWASNKFSETQNKNLMFNKFDYDGNNRFKCEKCN